MTFDEACPLTKEITMDLLNEPDFVKRTMEKSPREIVANCLASSYVLAALDKE